MVLVSDVVLHTVVVISVLDGVMVLVFIGGYSCLVSDGAKPAKQLSRSKVVIPVNNQVTQRRDDISYDDVGIPGDVVCMVEVMAPS